jgi:hypothetical protein
MLTCSSYQAIGNNDITCYEHILFSHYELQMWKNCKIKVHKWDTHFCSERSIYTTKLSHDTAQYFFFHIWIEYWSGSTKPVRLAIRATKLCTTAPNIFSITIAAAASVDSCNVHIKPDLWVISMSLLHVTLLARRIWRWLLYADCCIGYQN